MIDLIFNAVKSCDLTDHPITKDELNMIDPIINAESSHVTKDDSKSCPCHFIYYLHLYTRFDLTGVCVCRCVGVCVCV